MCLLETVSCLIGSISSFPQIPSTSSPPFSLPPPPFSSPFSPSNQNPPDFFTIPLQSKKHDRHVEPLHLQFLQAFDSICAANDPLFPREGGSESFLLQCHEPEGLEQRNASGSGSAWLDLRLSDEEGICAEWRSCSCFLRAVTE